MKFRFHHGGLQESLETEINVANIKELITAIETTYNSKVLELNFSQFIFDDRIGWDSALVTALFSFRQFDGPVGYVDIK
jgi:hypothetical protein